MSDDKNPSPDSSAADSPPAISDAEEHAYRKRQKQRSRITALLLGGMVVLFFLATLVRLGGDVGVDRFSGY